MASRKEQKEALRREREERERQEAAAAQRRRTLGYALAGVLVLGLLIAALAIALSGGGDGGGGEEGGGERGVSYPDGAKLPARRIQDLEPAAKAAGCDLRKYRDFGQGHTESPVTYKTNPPTSGPHNPIAAPDRLFSVAPPKEQLVHTLEHGRVVFQFKPPGSEEVRGQLRALYDEDPVWVAVTPNNTRMPYEVAATAWRQALLCPRWNARVVDALRAFRDRYRDRAPEPASAT